MKNLLLGMVLLGSINSISFANENPLLVMSESTLGSVALITSGPTMSTLVAEFENKEEAHANLDEIAQYNLNGNTVMSPSLLSKVNTVMENTEADLETSLLVVEEAAFIVLGE